MLIVKPKNKKEWEKAKIIEKLINQPSNLELINEKVIKKMVSLALYGHIEEEEVG